MISRFHAARYGAVFALCALSANAGNIIITGHDTDDHGASAFMNWALTALVNNGNGSNVPSTSVTGPKIAYLGNSSPNLQSYFGVYDTFTFYDLDNANWTNAFTDGNTVLVIGSGADFVNSTGSAALNARQASFISFFNAGGSILVNTEQGLGQSFYGFIPSFGGTIANSLPGCTDESGNGSCMNVTAQGTARGHTISHIVNADITHTRFTTVSSSFETLSTYVNNGGAGNGSAITIALFGGQASGGSGGSGGGFTPTPDPSDPNAVPEPATFATLGAGLAAVALLRRRR